MLPIYMIQSQGFWQQKTPFEKYPSIQRFCADVGYRKTFEQDVSRELGLGVDISVRIKPEWEILPKRWIVEPPGVWQNNLCKRRSTERPNRIKKFINPLNCKTFQWNSRMHSIECECGYSIGEH